MYCNAVHSDGNNRPNIKIGAGGALHLRLPAGWEARVQRPEGNSEKLPATGGETKAN